MQFAKRMLMVLGSLALLVTLISLAAPKAAHAIVATMVQVANTAANPAVTLDADKATRIPYQSSSEGTNFVTGLPCSGVDQNCSFSGITTPPAGYRLVIENISAYLYVRSGNPAPGGIIYTAAASTLKGATGFSGSYLGSSVQIAVINQSVKRYVNAGETLSIYITADYNGGANFATVTGYLENCAVTGCPPIQN